MGASPTLRTVTPESDVTDQTCEKPASNGHCDGVTVEKWGNGHPGAFGLVCEYCGNPETPPEPVQEYMVDGGRCLLHPRCEAEWAP